MRRWSDFIGGVLWLLVWCGLAVWGTLAFRPLYYYEMEHLRLAEGTGYSVEEIRQNYDALIDYNLAWGEAKLDLPTLPVSETGRIHFEEVKTIFDTFRWVGLGSAVLLLLWLRGRRGWRFLLWGGIGLGGVLLAVGALVLCWEEGFVRFHTLFFANDYWLFDPLTDPVIRILPDSFFRHATLLIGGGLLTGMVLSLWGYWVRYGSGRGAESRRLPAFVRRGREGRKRR